MDLPDVKAGMAIMAEHIQRLNAAVRQVQLRPGLGYFLKQSSGGTSLVIPQGTTGGGGGGGIPCPFECSDVSEGRDLKIEVAWGLVWNMLPSGMVPDNDPKLVIDVSSSCYIYIKIVFDTSTLLVTDVLVSAEQDLRTNTASTQFNLIAVVTVDESSNPKIISNIRNICQQPFPSPCSLS
jgi:hypothetical protein